MGGLYNGPKFGTQTKPGTYGVSAHSLSGVRLQVM